MISSYNCKIFFIFVLLIILLSSANHIALAQLVDSPWPMFRGNLKHTGRSNYNTSHVDGTIKWTYQTGAGIESSPSVGPDDTVYIGSHDNKLYAIKSDGSLKWRFDAGEPVYNQEWNIYKGILSSPAISSDGTVYIRSMSNKLFAVNADGSKKWEYPIPVTVDTWSSPAIGQDGTIYVGSARSGNETGKLYALNPDGSLKWTFPTISDVFPTAAISSDGTIYIGCGSSGILYAINPDGTEKWRFNAQKHIESSPIIGSDSTIYFGAWDGFFYALNTDGSQKWKVSVPGDGMVATPSLANDGTIYLSANDKNFYAFNPSDGSTLWRTYLGGGTETSSSPAIGSDGTIYLGVNEGGDNKTFYALNPDGSIKWSKNFGSISSSPAIGSDGTVYFGSWDGKVYALGGPVSQSTDSQPNQSPNQSNEAPTSENSSITSSTSPTPTSKIEPTQDSSPEKAIEELKEEKIKSQPLVISPTIDNSADIQNKQIMVVIWGILSIIFVWFYWAHQNSRWPFVKKE